MKVIGHRGAKSILTENTLESFKLAAKSKVDAIELDVRPTKDKQLVVCHNENLKKIYGVDKNIGDLTLAEVRQVKSSTGETIPTLEEVMQLDIGKPLVIDIKKSGSAKLIRHTLGRGKVKNPWSVTSLYSKELSLLKKDYSDVEMSLQAYTHPFRAIRTAKAIEASAITLVLYLLNPLTYWAARRAGLEVRTYQNYLTFLLNSPLFVRFLGSLYPSLVIYTDRPDKIVPVVKRR